MSTTPIEAPQTAAARRTLSLELASQRGSSKSPAAIAARNKLYNELEIKASENNAFQYDTVYAALYNKLQIELEKKPKEDKLIDTINDVMVAFRIRHDLSNAANEATHQYTLPSKEDLLERANSAGRSASEKLKKEQAESNIVKEDAGVIPLYAAVKEASRKAGHPEQSWAVYKIIFDKTKGLTLPDAKQVAIDEIKSGEWGDLWPAGTTPEYSAGSEVPSYTRSSQLYLSKIFKRAEEITNNRKTQKEQDFAAAEPEKTTVKVVASVKVEKSEKVIKTTKTDDTAGSTVTADGASVKSPNTDAPEDPDAVLVAVANTDGKTLGKLESFSENPDAINVAALQSSLVKLGYDLGDFGTNHDGVDGKFGAKTEQAVIAFKTKHKDKYGFADLSGTVDAAFIAAVQAEELAAAAAKGSDNKADIEKQMGDFDKMTAAFSDALKAVLKPLIDALTTNGVIPAGDTDVLAQMTTRVKQRVDATTPS